MQERRVADAFDSMLRTDYIALKDSEKLTLLADYFVDYLGVLPDLVGPTDQLIVGRRGTGKTTLLYRALVECMRSWSVDYTGPAKPRTLGVFVDLDKCNSLHGLDDYERFERSFVAEVCTAIRDELVRSWPALEGDAGIWQRLFDRSEVKKQREVNQSLTRLVQVLQHGLPRFVEHSAPTQAKVATRTKYGSTTGVHAGLQDGKLSADLGSSSETEEAREYSSASTTHFDLSVADFLRVIGELRDAADIPHFIVFIDEFSALPRDTQLKFTTLLKRMLGNHSGLTVKLCAITDHYTLGSSIILQRDLFQVSLDVSAFVERQGSVARAMAELENLTSNLIGQRLSSYAGVQPNAVLDAPEDSYREITRAAMGVPRTIGIILKQAWSRSRQTPSRKIRRSDIEYGINYAHRAYLDQMMGASKDGLAIPEHVGDVWSEIISRASSEKKKVPDVAASHFMVLPRHEEKLRLLNMFFLVHLIEAGRTTKKESTSRHLYALDYGATIDYHLGWTDDKNVLRQQRFVYDAIFEPFDRYYGAVVESLYKCPECGTQFSESQLFIAGIRLDFCPRDRASLYPVLEKRTGEFTEEEIKIVGSIRSSSREDALMARQVADDVGCYPQKVAKFGEKLERDKLIERAFSSEQGRYIYYSVDR